jgi:hypothetical protein
MNKHSYLPETANSPKLYKLIDHADCFCSLSAVDMDKGRLLGLCGVEENVFFVLPLGIVLGVAVDFDSIIEYGHKTVRLPAGERLTYGEDGAPNGIEEMGKEVLIEDYFTLMLEEGADELSKILIESIRVWMEAEISNRMEFVGRQHRKPESIKDLDVKAAVEWLHDLL